MGSTADPGTGWPRARRGWRASSTGVGDGQPPRTDVRARSVQEQCARRSPPSRVTCWRAGARRQPVTAGALPAAVSATRGAATRVPSGAEIVAGAVQHAGLPSFARWHRASVRAEHRGPDARRGRSSELRVERGLLLGPAVVGLAGGGAHDVRRRSGTPSGACSAPRGWPPRRGGASRWPWRPRAAAPRR